jgi:hypothetical protein
MRSKGNPENFVGIGITIKYVLSLVFNQLISLANVSAGEKSGLDLSQWEGSSQTGLRTLSYFQAMFSSP